MKSRKIEKRKESATLSRIIRASLRYASVPYVNLDGEYPEIHLTKTSGTVFVHRSQLMTLGTFQAVKFGGSKGGPGASWGRSGCRALEDGSGKEGRVGRSGQAT